LWDPYPVRVVTHVVLIDFFAIPPCIHTLWSQARLLETKGTDLRGRTAADAAFWFALAGAIVPSSEDDSKDTTDKNNSDNHLFSYLVQIATSELERFGNRPTCRSKHIWHIVERFAAAAILPPSHPKMKQLHVVAYDLLQKKREEVQQTPPTSPERSDDALEQLRQHTFSLHSDRPLLLLWKFSTKQRKQRAFLDSAAKHWQKELTEPHLAGGENGDANFVSNTDDILQESTPENDDGLAIDWKSIYNDTSRPLVVDVGCGMGVSPLGLASLNPQIDDSTTVFMGGVHGTTDWKSCNFAGVDLSRLAIGFAEGVAHRWDLTHKLHFFAMPAEELLEQVIQSYPGPISVITIQFPTPYRLITKTLASSDSLTEDRDDDNDARNKEDDENEPIVDDDFQGNSQLPADAKKGFMVTDELLCQAYRALSPHENGRLLLQSNCEDVAVSMRDMALETAGFQICDDNDTNTNAASIPNNTPLEPYRLTQRTERYAAAGGKRAEGKGWNSSRILPRQGSTETEVACELNGTPVHRCLLRASTASTTS
jgi:SAM-dependent methyltransferase